MLRIQWATNPTPVRSEGRCRYRYFIFCCLFPYFVEWRFDSQSPAVEYMSVDHGRFDILVPQQLLDRADVVAILEQMSCEGMAKGMRGNRFIYFCTFSCIPYGALQDAFIQVVTMDGSRLRVG